MGFDHINGWTNLDFWLPVNFSFYLFFLLQILGWLSFKNDDGRLSSKSGSPRCMIKAYLKFFSCYVSQKLIEILVKLIQNHKPFHLNPLYALAINFLISPIKTEKKKHLKRGIWIITKGFVNSDQGTKLKPIEK